MLFFFPCRLLLLLPVLFLCFLSLISTLSAKLPVSYRSLKTFKQTCYDGMQWPLKRGARCDQAYHSFPVLITPRTRSSNPKPKPIHRPPNLRFIRPLACFCPIAKAGKKLPASPCFLPTIGYLKLTVIFFFFSFFFLSLFLQASTILVHIEHQGRKEDAAFPLRGELSG
ncbi:hypothetical protein V8C42DRAFT_313795 [Trichoderma barbatum]